jgi:hypothetical protein
MRWRGHDHESHNNHCNAHGRSVELNTAAAEIARASNSKNVKGAKVVKNEVGDDGLSEPVKSWQRLLVSRRLALGRPITPSLPSEADIAAVFPSRLQPIFGRLR